MNLLLFITTEPPQKHVTGLIDCKSYCYDYVNSGH